KPNNHIHYIILVLYQTINGRGARELMKDGWIYEVAQWFPRASVYDDISGWQTDQFLGQGEFYLNFGNYDVSLTVPRTHIVQATGVLQNPAAVLTATQRARLTQAMTSDKPVFIVAADEVGTPGARPAGSGPLTWRFVAENVRDFAWGSSKAFVWDAQGFRYRPTAKAIELHSLYPREAMPLWNDVSTRAVRQTMVTYGRMAFEYPYPKAVNINGPVYGMEYPMVAFCGGRPGEDGKYTKQQEYALAAVTIHEVGHNWFPMIVASDERKWTWMDEGINSYLEYYGSKDYDPAWPATMLRGPAPNITGYMRQPNQMPLMTESDYILGNTFGNNGYSKPATGLVMLREQIVGADAFDRAFREYSNRWAFKHPQPSDFFRSIDDGAGELLNWFWRGWFYTTHANDQAVTNVASQSAKEFWGDESKGTLYTRVTIEQQGGLVMPIQLEIQYEDGSREKVAIPVEAWRTNEKSFTYGFFSTKAVTNVVVDPDNVFADIKRDNNAWKKPDAKPIG
ncbi:MAG: M1 family metallopeptidase, partial [Gemmatimonadaceae bacterium]|nr:M1 family metallopeptidase [Gemmatimonadaceae bacterium]